MGDWSFDLDALESFQVNPGGGPLSGGLSSSSGAGGADTKEDVEPRNGADNTPITQILSLTRTVRRQQNPLPFVRMVKTCFGDEFRSQFEIWFQGFWLTWVGKRNLKKDAVTVKELSDTERVIYARIRHDLDLHPGRRKRVLDFIGQSDVTKRLINYFVVHYPLHHGGLAYYLDRSRYPYRIVGELNRPENAEALALIEQGAPVAWINFHQEYKNCKNKHGRRNLHAPYRRSVTVAPSPPHETEEINLCEMNFYLWLDDVGGFELFRALEQDVRQQKSLFEKKKRQDSARKRPRPRRKHHAQQEGKSAKLYQARPFWVKRMSGYRVMPSRKRVRLEPWVASAPKLNIK